MNAGTFTVSGAWRTNGEGQEYEAVARTADKAKRIVARATGHVSLETGDDLDRAYGAAGRQAIEQSVNNICEQLALNFPG